MKLDFKVIKSFGSLQEVRSVARLPRDVLRRPE